MTELMRRRQAMMSASGNDIIASGVAGVTATWELHKNGRLVIRGNSETWLTFDDWNESLTAEVIEVEFIGITTTRLDATARNTTKTFPCENFYIDTAYIGQHYTNYPLAINFNNVYYAGNLSDWCKLELYRTNVTFSDKSFNLHLNNVLLSGDVTLPSIISPGTFRHVKNVNSLTVSSATSIIPEKFCENCADLQQVFFASDSQLQSIDRYAFYGCTNLALTELPNSVTTIGHYAFSGCENLTNITIPDNVTSIGDAVFSDCTGLASITIPNSVTSIGKSAFIRCTGLTSVIFDDCNPTISQDCFSRINNCVLQFGRNFTSIGDSVFRFGSNNIYDFSETLQIPYCNAFAFQGAIISKIIVPDALYDDWIVAENWSNYADKIVKASEV